MSLRVGCDFGSTAEDECQDVVMQDPPCWTATNTVLKAGRGLSSWLFSNLSPPSSPLVSFFCEDPFSPRRTPNLGYSPLPAASHIPYPSPTPSFISVLPQELLEEIFREYLYGPTATSPSPNSPLAGSFRRIITTAGTKTTPFTLAHVCSPWREIVMSNPSLWSKLCAFRAEHHDIPLYEFWLSRSCDYPLDMTIIQRGKVGLEGTDYATRRVLSLAFQHSYRWKAVSLQLDQDVESLFTKASHSLPLPKLQNFHLDLANWTVEGSRSISRMLSASPEVQGAAWGNRCEILPFIWDIPWARLHTVQLSQVDLLELCTILPLASSIVSLTIDFLELRCFLHNLPTLEPIPVPSLSNLTLTQYDELTAFFNMLSAPSLCSLSLAAGFGSVSLAEAGWASFSRFVHRSGCHISSLNWSHNNLAEEFLLHKLSQASVHGLQHLRYLTIESPVELPFVEAFTSHPGLDLAILPTIAALRLWDCRADMPSVRSMLASRPSLHRVDITLRGSNGVVSRLASRSKVALQQPTTETRCYFTHKEL